MTHKILWYAHTLRFLAFFTSLIAFFCHIAQCVLLNKYQEKTGIPDWLVVGHWQYLLWFITLGLSLVTGLAVCLSACYFNRPKKYTFDRNLGVLAMLPILVSLITAMSSDTLEPWTNNTIKVTRSYGELLSSCSLFDVKQDKAFPLLYQRCLLNDWTWILSILLVIFWITLVGIGMFGIKKQRRVVKTERMIKATTNTKGEKIDEPTWGRYIPDRPTSVYSVTTVGNRSGLITPTSIKYGSSFYYYGDNSSVPSLPSFTSSSRKGGDYYDKDTDEDDDHTYYDRSYKSSSKKSYHHNHSIRKNSNSSPRSSDYASPTTPSIGNYFTSKEYKSTGPTPSPTSIGDYFTSHGYKSTPGKPIRDYRSPSVSSSTYYNSTIAASEYNYDHDMLRSSTTHHNSIPSDNEDEEPARTPLYETFAKKSSTPFSLY